MSKTMSLRKVEMWYNIPVLLRSVEKCTGAGAPTAPLCKGSWQKSLIFD